MLEGCGNHIDFCLRQTPMLIESNPSVGNKIKTGKYLGKLHLQYCAILSQQNRHEEALQHAKYAAKYMHLLMNDLIENAERLLLETDISLLEGTVNRILPILNELLSKLIPETKQMNPKKSNSKIDMRDLFGYTSPGDAIMEYNIGNIMQLSPLTLIDLLSEYDKQFELTRESLLDKIALLVSAYFCISIEKRFLLKEAKSKSFNESEYYHAKALELACCFLPAECPLVSHIYMAYQKNYSAIRETIVIFNIISSLKMMRPPELLISYDHLMEHQNFLLIQS